MHFPPSLHRLPIHFSRILPLFARHLIFCRSFFSANRGDAKWDIFISFPFILSSSSHPLICSNPHFFCDDSDGIANVSLCRHICHKNAGEKEEKIPLANSASPLPLFTIGYHRCFPRYIQFTIDAVTRSQVPKIKSCQPVRRHISCLRCLLYRRKYLL